MKLGDVLRVVWQTIVLTIGFLLALIISILTFGRKRGGGLGGGSHGLRNDLSNIWR